MIWRRYLNGYMLFYHGIFIVVNTIQAWQRQNLYVRSMGIVGKLARYSSCLWLLGGARSSGIKKAIRKLVFSVVM